MTPAKCIWEILVPTMSNDGTPFRTRYHRVWDAKVRDISGGLTIMPVVKGQWVQGTVLFHNERMIPVRIIATREEIDRIIDITIDYYEQEAILAYQMPKMIECVYINRAVQPDRRWTK